MAVLPRLHYRQSPNYRKGRVHRVDLVVVHRPVGSYTGSINYLCQPRANASAHIVLGRPSSSASVEATQLVRWNDTAWACAAYNGRSDNLEIADDAWVGKDKEAWQVAARVVAFRLKARGLKPNWVKPVNGQYGGFTRHYDLGAAGGGHSDPTTSTVTWLRFVARVKWEFSRGGFREYWGFD